MNTLQIRLAIALMPAALALGAPSIAAPPATPGTPPMTGDITIIDTGDTYVPGYRITVGPTGELRATSFARNGRPTIRRHEQMTSEVHQRFLADLAKAAPVNNLPAGNVANTIRGGRRRRVVTPPPKPVTGAQVFIVYQKRTSPNMRIAASEAGKTLYQDIKQIMQVVRMPIPNVP